MGAGAGVNLNNVTGQPTRGRRAGTQRHTPASAAMQMPHSGLSAAAVQALASGWNLPNTLTQAQTAQVLRLAQVCVTCCIQYLCGCLDLATWLLIEIFEGKALKSYFCVPILQ